MPKRVAPIRTPPPCPRVCWEWLGRGRGGDLAWRYISSATGCGHYHSTEGGRWEWPNRPELEDSP